MRVLLALLVALGVTRAFAAPASQPASRAILPALWVAPGTPRAVADEARRALAAAVTGAAPLELSPTGEPEALAADRLRAAIVLYDRLRHDEARAALDQAAADATSRGAAGLTPPELADIYLYRALCAHVRGDPTRAWDDFIRAAVVAPGRVLDPARFPPRAVAMMKRAAEEVAAAPRGTLTILAPAGARVYVDGNDAGAAPAQGAALPYGQHVVRIEHPEHATWAAVPLAAPMQRLEPRLRRHAPPEDLGLAAVAQERGAAYALLVVVSRDGGAAAVEVRLVDRAGRRLLREHAPVAELRPALARAADAAQGPASRLVEAPVAPPPPPPVTPWYRRGWVWGAVAAAVVSAAVVIPLAVVDGTSATTFRSSLDLRPVRR